MSALTVLIIRHGEKPDLGVDGVGVDQNGAPDDKSLLVRGWQRAGTWAALFGSGTVDGDYPTPGAIYAASPDPQPDASGDGEGPSQRPYQTIVPLAARLHLAPHTEFRQGQELDLVAEITALTGVVLISWDHKLIGRSILPALLSGQVVPGVPAKWLRDRFDVVLRLDRAVPGAPWSFRQMFPRLLAGDTDVPM